MIVLAACAQCSVLASNILLIFLIRTNQSKVQLQFELSLALFSPSVCFKKNRNAGNIYLKLICMDETISMVYCKIVPGGFKGLV